MAAVVGKVSRHGLRIETHHRSQRNKTIYKLVLKLLAVKSPLEQLYISNKVVHS